MQLRAHGRGLSHGVDDVRGELSWVGRGKAQALEALDLAYLAQQLGKGELVTRQIWVSEVHSIGIDVLSKERDLGNTLVNQGLNLSEDVTWAAILFFTAEGRNDAEGTSVVAAHGHGYPACVGGLALGREHGREGL